MKIKNITARKILDSNSRGIIEVEIITSENYKAIGSIGSGTSIGKYEVNSYPKQGIDFLIEIFNKRLANSIKKLQIDSFDDLKKLEEIFKTYDNTENLENIGGNIILATEFAILKALSEGNVWKFLNNKSKKLPLPLGNCIGGGIHAGVNSPDIQEFLVLPKTKNFSEALFAEIEVYNTIKKELARRDKNFNERQDIERAWCPNMNNLEVLNILDKTADRTGRKLKIDIKIGLDIAASELWNTRKYVYKKFTRLKPKRALSREEQIEFIEKLIKNHNLFYVEDPLQQEDFDGFKQLNKKLCLICGDDLIATNLEILKKAGNKTISAVIIKPNQIGSLLKTKEVIEFARKNKIIPVISHRSNETNDNTLSHLAIAWKIPIIKTGISAGENTSKLNELLRISENL